MGGLTYWEAQEESASRHRQDPVPCGHRTEVPVSLQTQPRASLSFERHPHSLAHTPCPASLSLLPPSAFFFFLLLLLKLEGIALGPAS